MILSRLRSWWSTLWAAQRTSGQGSQATAWDGRFEDTYVSLWQQSLALDQLTRADFSCVLRAQLRDYPSAKEMRPRFVELVSRWVGDVATAYDRPPTRTFSGGPDVQAKLADIYQRSAVDAAMKVALRKLVTQNCVILLPWYKGLRQVEVLSFCPYEFEVTPGDPMLAGDIQKAAAVVLRVPVGYDDGAVVYGKLHLTQAELWVEDARGNRTSPYNADVNDLRNPFGGGLPAVALRMGDAPKGEFCGPVDQGLLAETVAICLGNAAADHTIKFAGFPTKYLKTTNSESSVTKADVDKLPTGPEYWAALPDGADIGAVHTQLQIAEIDNHLTMNLKNFAILRGLPPDWFLKTYTNVASKTLDRHDAKVRSGQYLTPLAAAEAELARWIVRISNLQAQEAVKLPDDVSLQIAWAEWLVDPDPVQAATAREKSYALGEDSPAAFVARRDNIAETVAANRVAELRSQTRAIQGQP